MAEVRGIAAVSALVLAVVSGCGPGEPERSGGAPRLLAASDIGDVTSSESYDGNGLGSNTCGPLGGFESNLRTSRPETVGKKFSVGKDEVVISSLLGKPVGRDSTEAAVTSVDEAIDECVTTASSDFERLSDLPAGAVGFRITEDSEPLDTYTERAYARISDTQIVVVTVQRTDGEPATKSVQALLPTAIERAQSS